MIAIADPRPRRPPIRHLATSPTGPLVAAGEFEHKVHIWSLLVGKHLRSFEAILDFGGKRLAISSNGKYLVAGAYDRYGVACYSVEHGTQVWHRPDLRKPQTIRFSLDDAHTMVATDDKRCRIVDAQTGSTLTEVKGSKDIIESPWQPIGIVSAKQIELRTPSHDLIITIPRTTFAELDVVFAHRHIIISETGGPIRCCDTTTGQEVWRHFEKGRHAIRLGYLPSTETVMAIDWAYERPGGTHRLLHYNVSTGHQTMEAVIDPGDYAFCLEGTRLLITNGTILDTQAGTKVRELWPRGCQ